jgi:hypothetical protein
MKIDDERLNFASPYTFIDHNADSFLINSTLPADGMGSPTVGPTD